MNIEDIYKLIEETEKLNNEYQLIIKERRMKRIKKEKSKKRKRIITIALSCGLPTALVAMLHLNQFLDYKEKNIYRNNTLTISRKKEEEITEELKEKYNISVEETKKDKYMLLNAILENNSLPEEEKEKVLKIIKKIIDIIPYLEPETSYYSLTNLNIYHIKKPFYEKENIQGRYLYQIPINYKINNIYLYYEDKPELLEHETIHCLLTNSKNLHFPIFISEGITELLTNECFTQNPYIEDCTYCLEIISLKMLFEIINENIVLKSYITGNINLIYNELEKINPKIDPKTFIEQLDKLLISANLNMELPKEKVTEMSKIFESYFSKTKNSSNPEKQKIFKYYLDLFNASKEKDAYSVYLNKIDGYYIPICYFNKEKSKTLSKNKKVFIP